MSIQGYIFIAYEEVIEIFTSSYLLVLAKAFLMIYDGILYYLIGSC